VHQFYEFGENLFSIFQDIIDIVLTVFMMHGYIHTWTHEQTET